MDSEARKVILLVEDESIIALSEKLTLRKLGYEILIASCGEEAVDTLNSGKKIDLILMDIDLGDGLSGPEAAEKILQKHTIPIVFLSSHAEREMVEKVRGITRYGYVIKSSGDFVLQTSIEMAFELFETNKKLMNELAERTIDEAVQATRLHLWEYSISHSLEDLIEEAMNEAEKLSGSQIGFYHFVADDQSTLILQNWSTRTKKEFCTAGGKGSHYDISRAGVWVDCIYQRRPVVHNDYASLPHRKGLPEGHAPVLREMVVPVFRGNKIRTIMGVGNKPSEYTEKDVDTLYHFADQIEDIILRKRAEEAHRESEEKFRTMTDLLPQIVFETDLEGKLTYVNRKGYELCGFSYPEDNMIGMRTVDFFVPEDKVRSIENIKKSMLGIIEKDGNEYTMCRKDGSAFNVLIFSSPIIKGNYPAGVRGIIVDITERKKSETKISNLLKEKEFILKEVHHRVKNNMTTIKSLLDLQAEIVRDSAAVEALRDAEGRIKSMMVLYDRLYKSDVFGEVHVNEYFSSLLDSILSGFPRANCITLVKDIDDFVLDVKTLQPLGIIINEIITNSMKYAFNAKEDCELAISAKTDNHKIVLRIKDNGSGIPESVSLENSSGFGLMLVGALIQQLEGNIRIGRNNGTEFIIELQKKITDKQILK